METSYKNNFRPAVFHTDNIDIGESYKIANNILKDEIAQNAGVSPSTLSSAANTVRVAKQSLPNEIPSAHCSLVTAMQPRMNYSLETIYFVSQDLKGGLKPAEGMSQTKAEKYHEKGHKNAHIDFETRTIFLPQGTGKKGEIYNDSKLGAFTIDHFSAEEEHDFQAFLGSHFPFMQPSKKSEKEEEYDNKFASFNVKSSYIPLNIAVQPNSSGIAKHFVTNESRPNNFLANERRLKDIIQKHGEEKDIQKKDDEKERLKKEVLKGSIRFCYNQFSTEQTAHKNQSLDLGEKKATPILMPARAA